MDKDSVVRALRISARQSNHLALSGIRGHHFDGTFAPAVGTS